MKKKKKNKKQLSLHLPLLPPFYSLPLPLSLSPYPGEENIKANRANKRSRNKKRVQGRKKQKNRRNEEKSAADILTFSSTEGERKKTDHESSERVNETYGYISPSPPPPPPPLLGSASKNFEVLALPNMSSSALRSLGAALEEAGLTSSGSRRGGSP